MKIIKLSIHGNCLDVGDSYSGLKEEVKTWLKENCEDWVFGYNVRHGYSLEFFRDGDETLFKLAWY